MPEVKKITDLMISALTPEKQTMAHLIIADIEMALKNVADPKYSLGITVNENDIFPIVAAQFNLSKRNLLGKTPSGKYYINSYFSTGNPNIIIQECTRLNPESDLVGRTIEIYSDTKISEITASFRQNP